MEDMKNIRITKWNVELVKEESKMYSVPKDISKLMISSCNVVADVVNKVFKLDRQTDEHFVMLALDNKNKIVGAFTITVGTIDSSLVNTRGIFQKALLCNASKIILAHNHPSGISDPSKDDVKVTRNIAECGDLLGIKLLDHIIIGDEEYTSLKSRGVF